MQIKATFPRKSCRRWELQRAWRGGRLSPAAPVKRNIAGSILFIIMVIIIYIIMNFTIINFTIICNPWDTGYILILLRSKNTLHMWADYLQSLTGSSYWPWLTRCLHFALWCDCLFQLENPMWTFIAHLDREFIGPVWAKVDVEIELCGPEVWYDLGSATHRSHHTLQHSHCDITTLQ